MAITGPRERRVSRPSLVCLTDTSQAAAGSPAAFLPRRRTRRPTGPQPSRHQIRDVRGRATAPIHACKEASSTTVMSDVPATSCTFARLAGRPAAGSTDGFGHSRAASLPANLSLDGSARRLPVGSQDRQHGRHQQGIGLSRCSWKQSLASLRPPPNGSRVRSASNDRR
jgi:hypothetical protein